MPFQKCSPRKSKGKEDDEKLVESGSGEDSEDSDEEDMKKKVSSIVFSCISSRGDSAVEFRICDITNISHFITSNILPSYNAG